MHQLARKSDKIAEAFIPHFPIILPSVDLLRNKHSLGGGAKKRPQSAQVKKFVKLVDLRRGQPEIPVII